MRLFFLSLTLVTGLASSQVLAAPGGMSLIRDEEIERMLKSWIRPVIIADGLDPDAIKIILVQSPDVNAFVAGGQNIFIYTGLLLKSDNAGEVAGVLSHELGHIAGGHLVRGRAEMENASFEAMLGSIIGLGAAILTGQGGAAGAIGGASASMATGRYLAFSRVQESSADQAALSGMQKAHLNPAGLKTFLGKMESEELLPSSRISYLQTHPLTRDRLQAVADGLERSPYKNDPLPAAWADQHARMKAKLVAFIDPGRVDWTYNSRDQSVPARYARAIAAYRQNNIQQALALTDGLLKDEPQNPYFLELKAQMLVDFGRVAEALPVYAKSVGILPDGGLIRIAYGSALIESAGDGRKGQLQQAVDQLKRAIRSEPRSITAQHLLATAYGRMGQEPVAKLHLAEEGMLKGDKAFARSQAQAALNGLKPGSPDWQRARDLLDAADSAGDGQDPNNESPRAKRDRSRRFY
jgi:predicted Zn-dependent protease